MEETVAAAAACMARQQAPVVAEWAVAELMALKAQLPEGHEMLGGGKKKKKK